MKDYDKEKWMAMELPILTALFTPRQELRRERVILNKRIYWEV